MKSLNSLLFVLLLAPASIALADTSHDSHSKTVDANGTAMTTDTSRETSVGLLTGTKKTTEEAETVVDPKGMMNKKTASMHSERKEKPNGDYSESTVVNHANGTKEKAATSSKTAKHWLDDGKTTTTTRSKSVDPKGLGNKSTAEVTEKVVTNPDGTATRTVTKKVDGDTVSEQTNSTH